MPKRNRFVRPERTRIHFVDVQRAIHEDLITKGVLVKEGEYRKATQDEISAAFARVQQAAEDGDWIDVKKELTAGETKRVFTDVIKGKEMRQGEAPILDPEKVGITNILAYLLAWSFLDEDGEPQPYSAITMSDDQRMDTIYRLSAADYQELDQAIDYHIAAVAAEREARKNAPAISSASVPTS